MSRRPPIKNYKIVDYGRQHSNADWALTYSLIALAKELKQFDIECEEVWGNGGVVKYVGSEISLVQLRK